MISLIESLFLPNKGPLTNCHFGLALSQAAKAQFVLSYSMMHALPRTVVRCALTPAMANKLPSGD
jgi:hypothetical protein